LSRLNWKRIVGWTSLGLAGVLIAAVLFGYLYLKSNRFQKFALRQIVDRAHQATGGRVEIGGMDFDLGTLTANLYNITLRGTEGPNQPPLFHAERLRIQLRIVSALHRQISLRELAIDHPEIYYRVTSDGRNNLPVMPASKGSSHISVFDLAVEHAQITKGEVNYNDRKIPLQADLHNLATDIHFESSAKRYSGALSYDDGRLQYSDYGTFSHNLSLQFRATQDRFDLDPAILRIGSSTARLALGMTNYSNPVADGNYEIQLHAEDFANLYPTLRSAGDVTLRGKLQFKQSASASLVRSISTNGQIASDSLAAAVSGRRVDIRHLKGTYNLAEGNLQIRELSLESLGGKIIASVDMKRLDTRPDASIQSALKDISLRDIQRALRTQEIPGASLSGSLNGNVEANWAGSIDNIKAKTDLAIRATAASRRNPATDVPVNGAIHATYDGRDQTMELHDTVLLLPSVRIVAQGRISNRSNLQVQAVANDLHQLVTIASSFTASANQPYAISGSATANVSVQGSMKQPTIAAQLTAQRIDVEGSEWKSANLALRANRSGVTIENASVVNAHQGEASLNGKIGLKNWSYQSSSPIQVQLKVQRLRLSELQDVAKQHFPVSGDLSAQLNVQGSQLQPVGSGAVQIANAEAFGEPIQNLEADFHTENETVVSAARIAAPAGLISAHLSVTPKTRAYKVEVAAPAVVLQKLRTVQKRNLDLIGTVAASVNGQGTLDDPQLTASIQLPELQVRQKSISALKAQVQVAEHIANLTVDSRIAEAPVHIQGKVSLSGEYETEGAIDTGTIQLAPLMAAYAPKTVEGFQGQTEMHATLKGPLKNTAKLEAHLSIPSFQANYRSLTIGIAHPIFADYADSVVTLRPAEIRGTETSLTAEGRIPIGGTASPTLTAQGSVNMRILQIFAPDVQSSGVLSLDVNSTGRDVHGQLKFTNVALTTVDAPIGVEKMNGTLDIANDRIQVSNVTAQMGGGQVSLGGSIHYRPSIEFNLAMQGQGMRLRYPEGLRSVLGANLALTGTTQASALTGRVLIENLSFTPDFDLANFADQFSTGSTVSQPGFADTIKLGINVQSQQNLNAVSSQISVAGQAALQVGGTAADPVITGRMTLTSGELFYRNVRYQLQRGLVTFDNPNETHPVMNVSVTTTLQQYNLTMTLRGPLDKLTTSYVSDPPLATADIINLVARGKTTEEQAASSQSTDSMIASQAASQLAGSVQKLAGISSLQIDPTLGGNQNPSARIALQQRVTKNLLFSFSTDVSQPGAEIVQGEYQINPRWSVSLQRDQLGGVSVDGKFHKKF
jgi:translocation and assembly module TamB